MAEVKEFTLPDLGEGLTEAEVVRWLVEVGEVVAVDQPVVEVETAKAVVEVPCPYGGVVTARYGTEGETVAVGRPLVTVAVGPAVTAPSGAGTAGPEEARDEASGSVLVGYGTGPAARRRRARVRPAADGREPAPPGGPAAPDRAGERGLAGPVAVISPLVRRLAREQGLDLRSLTGTGPDGLILRADVERALGTHPGAEAATASSALATDSTTAPATALATAPAAVADGAVRVPLRGMLGAAAEKLARSRREIPDATCWVDADATELLAVRAAMNARHAGNARNPQRGGAPEPVSVLALLARITTAALARHPELNATVDTGRGEVVRLPAVHLGFAAQTDRGLVVPVLRDAHTLTTAALSARLRELTEAARTGALAPADLTGGTFTLNNYGVFGVDGSTPILNHPEAGMLGVGRITPKPWVRQGELAVRQVVQLSLTFDHRVCDGAVAGGFLRFVADCVEDPAVLLAAV
ncbi:dihydrolipoamide acetyltransferase family protein [Actinacidiphila yeochonensis]|uniref:dihydrolipoamide acetyltransferase family protein n=1 Tax=Actinacidiphila yeochonensis TaxID=89050 RepID=UPI00055D4750|nr:dihydrolipoamide acetyltransferase family protein [Actinacidiphila yeochonensis]